MSGEDSILKTVRDFVVGEGNEEFDKELLPHINSALSKLNQNGIGNFVFVKDDKSTWDDFKDETQKEGNKYFQMTYLYVILSTQLLFDPPPPSNVEYHSNSAKEILWRLKIAYER